MGCTASTPAQRRFDPEPVVVAKDRLPVESQTVASEALHNAYDTTEKPLSTANSSATSMGASQPDVTQQVRQASSTKLVDILAKPENQVAKQIDPAESSPEKPPRPPAREDQQPPMKRVAIVDNEKASIIPKLVAADGSQLDATRRLEDFYEVDRSKRIGKGHYASVFVGINRTTGDRVAVKMIEKRLSKTERLALEVNVMRKAGAHPHIVQLLDVFETETQLQLVLELVEGGELFEHLVEHGPYSESTAALHIRDVTKAIAFLHAQNIIHRDLKPENILLTSKDDSARVKVADFGLAKLMFADVTRTVCGTWAYCAYEVKKPGGAYDNKCDVWSIGVIAYILLSAYHPFDPLGDATDDEIWERISRCDYNFSDPAWDNVSPSARDFVSKLLVHDPKKRMSAEEALLHPWLSSIQDDAKDADSQPALSPRIDHKLDNYLKRSAMNPLQRAAAAMRGRVGSWKTSNLSANSSSNNSGNTSPSSTMRNFVIAAAAAAAATKAAARRGAGVATGTNNADPGLKGRTWSMGSSGRNIAKEGGSQSSGSPVASMHKGGSAESFNESSSNQTAPAAGNIPNSTSQPFVSSPLRTVGLAPQPTNETLLVPPTPNVGDGQTTETKEQRAEGAVAMDQSAFDEIVAHGLQTVTTADVLNSPAQAIAALRVAETGDDATVRSSDLDTISSEDEGDGEEDTLEDGQESREGVAEQEADEHNTASFASSRSEQGQGFESFKTAREEHADTLRSVEDV